MVENTEIRKILIDQGSLQKYGKTFHFASQVFSSMMMSKIARLYQFCRFVDDCADLLEPELAKKTLTEIQRHIDSESVENPELTALINELESYGVHRSDLSTLNEGALFDVQEQKVGDQGDLLRYCYKVAGVVGLMVSPIIGVKSRASSVYAVDLGIGMQLTNICRDVLEDANNGRSYLPLNEVESCGLSIQIMSNKGETPVNLKQLVKKYLDIADVYYTSAFSGYAYIPLRPRLTILFAGEMYRAIGTKLRKSDFAVLSGRTYLSKREKLWVCVKSLAKVLSPKFWFKGSHEPKLHGSLKGLPGIHESKESFA